jgi:outer membrane receptor protein involved in Fe transport
VVRLITFASNRKGDINFSGDGAFDGSSPLEDFLAGVPSTGKIFVGDSERKVHLWSFGWYVADDWRVNPHLSVNLGLRYELNTVIKADHNLLGNFDPNVGFEQVGINIKSPYNGDHNNFAPRIGEPGILGRRQDCVSSRGGYQLRDSHISLFYRTNR